MVDAGPCLLIDVETGPCLDAVTDTGANTTPSDDDDDDAELVDKAAVLDELSVESVDNVLLDKVDRVDNVD